MHGTFYPLLRIPTALLRAFFSLARADADVSRPTMANPGPAERAAAIRRAGRLASRDRALIGELISQLDVLPARC